MNKNLKILSFFIIFSLLFNISFNVFAIEQVEKNATNETSKINEEEQLTEVKNNSIEEKKIQSTNTKQENLNSKDLKETILEENLDTQNSNAINLQSKARISTFSLNSYEGTPIEGKSSSSKVHVYRDGKNYIYSRVNGANFIEIQRYCFETGEFKTVFENWNNFDVETVSGKFIQDKIIYHAVYSTTKYDELRVIGYDTQTETICYDQTFPITLQQFESQFCVDNNQNLYFVTTGNTDSEVTLLSYTKDGKLIDSYTEELFVNGCDAIDLVNTNKENTVLFLAVGYSAGISSWWNDGILKIDNGKFVDEKIYILREFGGMVWRFLDDSRTHAYDQYGEFYEINYNADNEAGVSYTIKGSIDINGSYSNIANITSSDDTYAYIGGKNGLLHIYNWHTNKIEKYLEIGEGKTITCVCKNGDELLVEYYKDGTYYSLTININDFNVVTHNIAISDHISLTHTKSQIKNKYDELSIINTTSDLYEQTPSITAPYTAGSLLPQVKTDTINQINYFRWITGLNNITQNEQYMEYSQKGAVLLAARGLLTHYPARPSDMDEEFYEQGYKAASAGIGYSANISKGSLMANSIKGYIDDTSNMYPDVGHRLSLLDPDATSVSFGYANSYGVVNVFTEGETNNDEAYYAWPSPGNFPVESINYNAMWSVTLTNKGYFVDAPRYIVLKANGKEYSSANEDFTLYYDNIYKTYYFDIPTELRNYLTDGNYSIQNGKSVEIEIYGLADNYGNTYVIKYPINFFSLDKVLTDISLDSTTVRIGDTKKIELKMTPEGAEPDGEIKWSSSNTNVATISDDGTITAKTKGTTTITAEVDGLTATATINVIDYILGDVNGDGKVTLVDYGKILSHVKGLNLLTGQNLKAADVNQDGKVTLVDYGKVLAYVKRNVPF